MVPPIECDLGYQFRSRTLKANPNPNPKSNKNLCSAKRHPNKVQDCLISYFPWAGGGYIKGLYRKVVANDDN